MPAFRLLPGPDNLYKFENQTFDESTTLALTVARRAAHRIDIIDEELQALTRELTWLAVNNRCRRQDVEWLNHYSKTVKLAHEWDVYHAHEEEEDKEQG